MLLLWIVLEAFLASVWKIAIWSHQGHSDISFSLMWIVCCKVLRRFCRYFIEALSKHYCSSCYYYNDMLRAASSWRGLCSGWKKIKWKMKIDQTGEIHRDLNETMVKQNSRIKEEWTEKSFDPHVKKSSNEIKLEQRMEKKLE